MMSVCPLFSLSIFGTSGSKGNSECDVTARFAATSPKSQRQRRFRKRPRTARLMALSATRNVGAIPMHTSFASFLLPTDCCDS